MKKNNLKIMAVLFSAIITFNSLSFALADNQGWMVAKDNILIFNIKELDNGETIELGTFNVTILDINSTGAIFYDLNAIMTTDINNYATNLTTSNNVEIGEKLTILSNIELLFSKFQTNLMIENDNDDYLEMENYYFDTYNGNADVRYSLIKLTYGYELKFEDIAQGIELYTKMQRDNDGILRHYEIANLNSDGLETGIKITFKLFGGEEGSGIPGFKIELMLFLSIITFVGIIYKRRRE